MLVLVRAALYAILFVSLVLVLLPAQILSRAGIVRPQAMGIAQIVGMIGVVIGCFLALWCVWTFARIGRGTPAPFDPPRRLVMERPYSVVRNPMYVGAGLALCGAALFYGSLALLGYAALLFIASHLFIVLYEEPTLRKTFGKDYESYCHEVGRWWPRVRRR